MERYENKKKIKALEWVLRYYLRGLREYKILSEISKGGMSRVYKAQSQLTGNIAAIKILLPECSEKRRVIENSFGEKHVENGAAAALMHPNVIRTYSCGRAKKQDYAVMEYIDGPNLKNIVCRQPELLRGGKSEIILGIAEGLRYIHSKGIIHRDICLKNILLSSGGEVKIIDFSLAVEKRAKYKARGERSGTPSYMPPEQIKGFEADLRSDIYSFGATMYEILAEKPIVGGDDDNSKMQNHLNAGETSLCGAAPGISEWLAMIIGKAMRKNPENRYGSMDSLISDLKGAFREEPWQH